MPTTPGSKSTILLVEDDASAGRTLAQLLREDGYEVDLAPDGETASATLASAPAPDVLVVAHRLPHVDGPEVGALGRRLHPGLHVVVITSYAEAIARVERRPDDATVILAKPLIYLELTRELERMCPKVAG